MHLTASRQDVLTQVKRSGRWCIRWKGEETTLSFSISGFPRASVCKTRLCFRSVSKTSAFQLMAGTLGGLYVLLSARTVMPNITGCHTLGRLIIASWICLDIYVRYPDNLYSTERFQDCDFVALWMDLFAFVYLWNSTRTLKQILLKDNVMVSKE